MLWLKQAKAKLKGVDEFYVDLNLNQIGIYQRIFDSLLASIDIDTETAWSKGEKYDKVRFEKDEKTINSYCELAEQRGCNPAYLLIMFHQYIFADPWRE